MYQLDECNENWLTWLVRMAMGSDLTSTSLPWASFGIWSWFLKICGDIVTYFVRFGETYISGSWCGCRMVAEGRLCFGDDWCAGGAVVSGGRVKIWKKWSDLLRRFLTCLVQLRRSKGTLRVQVVVSCCTDAIHKYCTQGIDMDIYLNDTEM